MPDEPSRPLRRSRLYFTLAIGFIAIMLVWPGFTLFATARPFILGFPLSFAWVIGGVLATFLSLLLLYRSDYPRDSDGPNRP
ncbi:MAG: hypothetical protein ACQER4_06825 [Bacteroidota bacterium]